MIRFDKIGNGIELHFLNICSVITAQKRRRVSVDISKIRRDRKQLNRQYFTILSVIFMSFRNILKK